MLMLCYVNHIAVTWPFAFYNRKNLNHIRIYKERKKIIAQINYFVKKKQKNTNDLLLLYSVSLWFVFVQTLTAKLKIAGMTQWGWSVQHATLGC